MLNDKTDRREYYREYYAKHREKNKEYSRTYQKEHKEKMREYDKKRGKRDRSAYQRDYYQKNKERPYLKAPDQSVEISGQYLFHSIRETPFSSSRQDLQL